jgi:ABC-type antimicrobial peptide transport system permease subunit
MSGNAWSTDVWFNGRAGQGQNPYFLAVGEGWFDTMRVPLIEGRAFRRDDRDPDVAIVSEAFARKYFNGQNPVGKSFERSVNKKLTRVQIVGLSRDVRYANMREPIRPIVFVPMRSSDWATFLVRTDGADPSALASTLRHEIPRVRSDLRVININTQAEVVMRHTLRERLLATLSLFFATVALLLAGVGLYGVLNYSVVQRSREIGIRMALGARPRHVARGITAQLLGMLAVGSAAGLGAGLASEHYLQTLLYGVTVRDTGMLMVPLLTLFTVSLLAAMPPVLRAVRIDPAVTLRAD